MCFSAGITDGGDRRNAVQRIGKPHRVLSGEHLVDGHLAGQSPIYRVTVRGERYAALISKLTVELLGIALSLGVCARPAVRRWLFL